MSAALAAIAMVSLSLSPAAAVAAHTESDAMEKHWMESLWPPAREVRFAPTTLEEREAFTKLIPAILAAAPKGRSLPDGLVEQAKSAGFSLESWHEGEETFWTLRELPGHYRGAGAYVFRTGNAAEIVIQAPHADFDVGTGKLGALLFLHAPEGKRPRAFITNTAHRYKSRPDEKKEDEDHPADVAHNPEHLFQITTDLIAQSLKHVRVVQLHGFGKNEAREASLTAVVSAGSQTPTPWVTAVANELRGQLGNGVRLFPRETNVLGGTTNAQARLLRSYPSAQFLHLELSSDARKELVTPERLQAFARALLETPSN